jgi:DNA-binding IclR family transcriptional regulator
MKPGEVPLGAGAPGKVLVADLDSDELEWILREPLAMGSWQNRVMWTISANKSFFGSVASPRAMRRRQWVPGFLLLGRETNEHE